MTILHLTDRVGVSIVSYSGPGDPGWRISTNFATKLQVSAHHGHMLSLRLGDEVWLLCNCWHIVLLTRDMSHMTHAMLLMTCVTCHMARITVLQLTMHPEGDSRGLPDSRHVLCPALVLAKVLLGHRAYHKTASLHPEAEKGHDY